MKSLKSPGDSGSEFEWLEADAEFISGGDKPMEFESPEEAEIEMSDEKLLLLLLLSY